MSSQLDLRGLEEAAKYDLQVERASDAAWWDPTGLSGGLHLLNDIRVPYFEKVLHGYSGKRILDVGCGGGIFSESAARAGAHVVALDPSERSLEVARKRARKQGLSIDYRFGYIEKFKSKELFDAVIAVDVLEHVADLDVALDVCAAILKPGGMFGFLTHNQTLEAFKFFIWEGEYQLKMIPKGNHDFHKFMTPEDLEQRLAKRGLPVAEVRGLKYLIKAQPPRAAFTSSTAVSYMGCAWKGQPSVARTAPGKPALGASPKSVRKAKR
ncbi:bifunctional 2-polyprenyl-6-hydroxyphenol methylase/3-demethylubiquinol 3-O-methyltransferase UbiG [Hyalangium sp.]|uniref:bifunctional 2-polyprenyl-6-hydroxyphenol methylase/3-demethylubiquinol 3-O-methyltransferase UbiG n=1 Tax=Hyalangium sp. TaxID=2028555 RepID=UPI002D5DDE57|nr:bifunctional 2-polyprenyl-6-hydroxyphenol methylase/3-demethylubiquinol 3-O-methyltransferase UbiG [Hyalangium sp.]HYH97671.1 bifunctional 2-polyprenyl-6-hydroxyphenol methylase/3-demethylubiquinol 3-O-methyltransferase UbiG [Hyalangium sp.]